MDIKSRDELETWSVTVRKIDSSLHAAFARQEREAARKQSFWKRGHHRKGGPSGKDLPPALQGGAV